MISDKKEKILIYTTILLVIVLVLVLIIIVWKSSIYETEHSELNSYSNVLYQDVSSEYYRNFLNKNLKISNFGTLYSSLNKNYISSLGLDTEEKTKKYFIDQHLISNDIQVMEVTSSETEFNNFYRVTYKAYGIIKYANIVEESPYHFTISFEQENMSNLNPNSKVTELYYDILFNFELMKADNSSVKYKITITNNSVHEYTFNFNSITGAQLRFNKSNYVSIATLSLSPNNNNTISPGSSKTVEFLYNIPFKNQMQIDGFLFTNIKNENNEEINIELDF